MVLRISFSIEDPLPFNPWHCCLTNGSGKRKKEVNISGDILTGERQKQGQPNAVAEDYKFPLVWIDLEMTGT